MDTILFKAGSEFLICKEDVIDGIQHVYIRQIELGWGESVVFWLDDQIFTPGNET